jgi:hypothetical protein
MSRKTLLSGVDAITCFSPFAIAGAVADRVAFVDVPFS